MTGKRDRAAKRERGGGVKRRKVDGANAFVYIFT